jgi:hypothetical protein
MTIPFRLTLTVSLIILGAVTLLARPVTSASRNLTPTPTVLESMRAEDVHRRPDERAGTQEQHPNERGDTIADRLTTAEPVGPIVWSNAGRSPFAGDQAIAAVHPLTMDAYDADPVARR